ncbi:MAG: hypothetical protein ACK5CE_15450 [Actinomycetes bacterium]
MVLAQPNQVRKYDGAGVLDTSFGTAGVVARLLADHGCQPPGATRPIRTFDDLRAHLDGLPEECCMVDGTQVARSMLVDFDAQRAAWSGKSRDPLADHPRVGWALLAVTRSWAESPTSSSVTQAEITLGRSLLAAGPAPRRWRRGVVVDPRSPRLPCTALPAATLPCRDRWSVGRRRRRIATAVRRTRAVDGIGSSFGGMPRPHDLPERNPFLSSDIYGVTHVNPGQQNSIPYEIPLGTRTIDLGALNPVWGGPVNNATYASVMHGYFWSVATDRVALIDARDKRWDVVADIDLPGASRRSQEALRQIVEFEYADIASAEAHLKAILGDAPGSLLPTGVYALVSNEDVVYSNAGTTVSAIGLVDRADPSRGLEVKGQFDTSTIIPPTSVMGEEPRVGLVGMNMTYDGHVVVGALNGVAVIDAALTSGQFVSFDDDDQMATNSLAVDAAGGIYVATGSKTPRMPGVMRKLVWTGERLSDDPVDGAWAAQYDGGDWPPAIKAGTGTGSTPTLMGFGEGEDELVLITDGTNRMKLVAFWRNEIPAGARVVEGALSPRIADQKPVRAGISEERAWLQSEQTIIVLGTGAFVVNNLIEEGHPDRIIDVLTVGPVHAPPHGVEKLVWNQREQRFYSGWARGDVVSISMVPLASSGAGAVFVNGYSAEDGWEVTGLDWETGKTVSRTIFGHDNKGNGTYAILQFLEDGDMLFNSVIGPYRIPLDEASHRR